MVRIQKSILKTEIEKQKNALKKNTMKKLLLLIITIISQLLLSQEYPLDYKGDVPNGAYYKDLNGELNKYVGLWKGSWNGKILYLDLRKVKYYYSGNAPYYEDKIFGERKIIASDGTIEIDRISNFGSDGAEFHGMSTNLKNGNIKRMFFYPRNMCRKQAALDIMSFTGNQMTLHLEYLPSNIDESCPYYNSVMQGNDYPINFPKDITLTKQ